VRCPGAGVAATVQFFRDRSRANGSIGELASNRIQGVALFDLRISQILQMRPSWFLGDARERMYTKGWVIRLFQG